MADRRVRYILEVDYDGGGAALRAADDLREVDDAARQAGDGLAQAEGGFSKFQAGIVTLSSGLNLVEQGFGFVAGAAGAAWDALGEGAALIDQQEDWEALADSIGATADVMLNDMSEAAGGMMTNAEMIGAASDLIMLNLGLTKDQITGLVGVAGELEWSMDAVANVLNTKSTRGLKELGLGIDDVKAKVADLEAAGYSLNEAFALALLDAGRERIELVGGASETTAGQMEIAQNKIDDFTAALKIQAVQIAENIDLFDGLVNELTHVQLLGDVIERIKQAREAGIPVGGFIFDLANYRPPAEIIAEIDKALGNNQVTWMGWAMETRYSIETAAESMAMYGEGIERADQLMLSFQQRQQDMAKYDALGDARAQGEAYVADLEAWGRAVDELAAKQEELIAIQEEWIAYTAEMEAMGGDQFTQMWQSDQVWDFGAALYNAADAAGAGAGPLGDLAVSLGLIDEATANAATAQVQAESIATTIAQAAVAGKIAWEEYATTVERAIEVVNGAALIDLGPRQAPEMDDRGFREGFAENFEPQTREMSEYFTVRMDADVTLVESAVQTATGLVEGFAALAPEVVAEMNILSVTNGAGEVRRILAELPSRKEIVIDVTVTGMGIVNQLQALGALP